MPGLHLHWQTPVTIQKTTIWEALFALISPITKDSYENLWRGTEKGLLALPVNLRTLFFGDVPPANTSFPPHSERYSAWTFSSKSNEITPIPYS